MLDHLRRRLAPVTRRCLTKLYQSANLLSRKRPVWMVSFAMSEASVSEGLRAACASTAMLVVGNLLHEPAFAWAAIGAFWTCLADAAGSNRARFASMTSFALLSTVGGGIASFASGTGVAAAAVALLVLTSLGALGRIWGAASAQVAILAATACVVMVDRPMRDLSEGAVFLGVYLTGCLFAVALSLSVWRIHPFGPSRVAVRAVYARLADIALDTARLVERSRSERLQWDMHASRFRGDARAAIERARRVLANVPASKADRRDCYANLLIAVAEAERLFAYLIAVSGLCQRGPIAPRDARRAARALTGVAELLRRIGAASGDEAGARPLALRSRLQRVANRLDRALGEPLAWRFEPEPAERIAAPKASAGIARSVLDALARAAATLRANLSWQSIGLRHAARVGVATTAGFVIVRLLDLPFGYWATMAVLLILQPSIAGTWPRSVERAAGSIAGGLLAAALGLAIHSPIGISLAVFPLICATMALRPVSYSLFVLFLTPAFVLVADFATPGASELVYAATRLANNVLGCGLALFATFALWPNREPIDIGKRLASAVSANLRYLTHALTAPAHADDESERLRRAAGLASNNAEEAFNRLRLERLDGSRADAATATVLGLVRRMAGTAAHLRLASRGRRRTDEALVAWLDATSHAIDASLAGTSAPAWYALPERERLAPAELDAVGQIALLQRVLAEHAQERHADAAAHARGARQPG